MDALVAAALDDICAGAAAGVAAGDLWHQHALATSGILPSMRPALWARLVALPVLLFTSPDGRRLVPGDTELGSPVSAAELGVHIVAAERLRDSFLGIHGQRAVSGLSAVQRAVLERIAAARTSGVTQNELAKEFGIKGSNFFYVVKTLESQHLIVRYSTIVRSKESAEDAEDATQNTSIVNTNSVFLYRYAKDLNVNTFQRIEIIRPDYMECKLDDKSSFEKVKDDISIKDYIPAMKCICDKLDEASGKVLAVSDIKQSLNYTLTPGHRLWRMILSRLKDAKLVETFDGRVENKVVECLRLVRRFDPNEFQCSTSSYNNLHSESSNRHGRGQATDQFLELPLECQIYDMIEAEGSIGITYLELSKRLGISSKKLHNRMDAVLGKYNITRKVESFNRSCVHRVWTSRNFALFKAGASVKHPVNYTDGHNIPTDSWAMIPVNDTAIQKQEVASLSADNPFGLDGTQQLTVYSPFVNGSCALNDSIGKSRSSTLESERRQQILDALKEKKFMLTVELHKLVDGLKKEKHTKMGKRTLVGTLNKLQKEGLCKLKRVKMPTLTNFKHNRMVDFVLHPSINSLSFELLEQVKIRQRQFDRNIRRAAMTRKKNSQPAELLATFKKSSCSTENKSSLLEVMHTNGFISAKMVRAKLLHKFLWSYVSCLPGWCDALALERHIDDQRSEISTCQLFSLDAAIKEIPLELFLQIVGSPKQIDDMAKQCRQGTKFSGLSQQEQNILLDHCANSRLSRLIDILDRLKLIQLVSKQQSVNNTVIPDAVLTHAIELKPYFEEPLSKFLSSAHTNGELCHKVRHDFTLFDDASVDAYWKTLEYCYSSTSSAQASSAFPGSSVPEVFLPRSWTSIRVMTTEQRLELEKRVMDSGYAGKLPFTECVRIALELNLTVEQVLRMSRWLANRSQPSRKLPCREQNSAPCTSRSNKRKGSFSDNLVNSDEGAAKKKCLLRGSMGSVMENMDKSGVAIPNDDHGKCVSVQTEVCNYRDEPDYGSSSFCASNVLKPRTRQKKFAWTDACDRQLVMMYARQRATLGARFYRVSWNSLSNLPALPLTCQRRMGYIMRSAKIRKSVLRLCNLLGHRYVQFIEEGKKERERGIISQAPDATSENNKELFCEQWDNFEVLELSNAVEEVIQCIHVDKQERVKSIDMQPVTDGDHIKRKIGSEGSKDHAEMSCEASTIQENKGASYSRHTQKKFVKVARDKLVMRDVNQSLVLANAVELLKLVFLSTSSEPEVQGMLEATLQLYSQTDIFAAYTYLKEKNYVVTSHSTRRHALSGKFFYEACYSPFPVGSGKRAAEFSMWLRNQEKNLMEGGAYVSSELHCGEVTHIFALLSKGELVISPLLPASGIGEADESGSPNAKEKSGSLYNLSPKRKSEKVKIRSKKIKKQKKQSKFDTDFTSRREKGFPGLQVMLHHGGVQSGCVMQISTNKVSTSAALACQMNIDGTTDASEVDVHCKSSKALLLKQCHSNPQLEFDLNKYPWDNMAKFAMVVLPVDACQNEPYEISSDLLRSSYTFIKQAGEQGLRITEISRAVGLEASAIGMLCTEAIVDTLVAFHLACKVNAYDNVHIVDSSFRSKYHIRAYVNHGTSGMPVLPFQVHNTSESQEIHQLVATEAVCCSQSASCGGHEHGSIFRPKKQDGGFHSRPSTLCDSVPIFPWINGDGTVNAAVYKGLVRRVLGYVMQYPGILEEEVIRRMGVLNPQTCRTLLDNLVRDGHLSFRELPHTLPAPPALLQSVFGLPRESKPSNESRKHFYANPTSTHLL